MGKENSAGAGKFSTNAAEQNYVYNMKKCKISVFVFDLKYCGCQIMYFTGTIK